MNSPVLLYKLYKLLISVMMLLMKAATAKKPSKNHARLLDAAQQLFVEKGYNNTGTEEIVKRAGITRGALYYQFNDKQHLFRALFEQTLQLLGDDLFKLTMGRIEEDVQDLAVGTQVLLDLYSRPDIKQIVLLDGPVVLGWQLWRDLQRPLHMALLTHSLEHLVELNYIPQQPLEPLAELIMGALMQAGLAIANADKPQQVRKLYGASLQQLLIGLAPDLSFRGTRK